MNHQKGQGKIEMSPITRPTKVRGKIRFITAMGGNQETILEVDLDKKNEFLERLKKARETKGLLYLPTPSQADTWVNFEFVMTTIIEFNEVIQ